MEDEVCDCFVEILLKQSFYCTDFASEKKIIHIGTPTPSLTKIVEQ
jgi:hypothetical protein